MSRSRWRRLRSRENLPDTIFDILEGGLHEDELDGGGGTETALDFGERLHINIEID